MARFDYPSPYWDSVGDSALDLIDRMLTVDVDQRITIDECLEHPWTTQETTADSLTGAMGQLDFSKRKVLRERTLLSDLNDVKVSKVVEWEDNKAPVKVFEKNPDGKRVHSPAPATTNGHTRPKQEELPAVRAEVFMEMGGKGDQQLFENDKGSRYELDEKPR